MEVGGIISANSKKNTVNESRIEMDKDTWVTKEKTLDTRATSTAAKAASIELNSEKILEVVEAQKEHNVRKSQIGSKNSKVIILILDLKINNFWEFFDVIFWIFAPKIMILC